MKWKAAISNHNRRHIVKEDHMKTQARRIGIFILVFLLTAPAICRSGEIILLLPKYELAERTSEEPKEYTAYPMEGRGGRPVYTEKNLSDMVAVFRDKKYRVDQIELWISGWEEISGKIQLIVSSEEEGGFKITLRPED
jgi:hypothetical protein